jgi:membrane protein DedA with SNARE-associated domain
MNFAAFQACINQGAMQELISKFGNIGVFVAMFLESSIVPIPSEAVIITAGCFGISLVSVTIYGSLGSTLGGMVGYLIGRFVGLPVILRFGKYVFITEHHIQKAENFARKYGTIGVLIGRLLPVIPFKVFSIASGITRIPVIPFLIWTLVGVIPRIILLTLFGAAIMQYKKAFVILCGVALIGFIAYHLVKSRKEKIVMS